MSWPPKVGEALPRGTDAWCVRQKWVDWILSERGHGPEWLRLLRVEADDWQSCWQALKEAAREAPIQTVRREETGGVSCGVVVELWVGERAAMVISAWHYAEPGAAPRLITAYPRPYNQAYGRDA